MEDTKNNESRIASSMIEYQRKNPINPSYNENIKSTNSSYSNQVNNSNIIKINNWPFHFFPIARNDIKYDISEIYKSKIRLLYFLWIMHFLGLLFNFIISIYVIVSNFVYSIINISVIGVFVSGLYFLISPIIIWNFWYKFAYKAYQKRSKFKLICFLISSILKCLWELFLLIGIPGTFSFTMIPMIIAFMKINGLSAILFSINTIIWFVCDGVTLILFYSHYKEYKNVDFNNENGNVIFLTMKLVKSVSASVRVKNSRLNKHLINSDIHPELKSLSIPNQTLVNKNKSTSAPWKSSKGFGGIEAFMDLPEKYLNTKVGDAWNSKFLNKKSFGDLYKLWFKLLIEKNCLHSDFQYRRNADIPYDNQKLDRFNKVRKSMNRIKSIVKKRNLDHKRSQIKEYLGEKYLTKLDSIINPKRKGKNRPKTLPNKYRIKFHKYLHRARRIKKGTITDLKKDNLNGDK